MCSMHRGVWIPRSRGSRQQRLIVSAGAFQSPSDREANRLSTKIVDAQQQCAQHTRYLQPLRNRETLNCGDTRHLATATIIASGGE